MKARVRGSVGCRSTWSGVPCSWITPSWRNSTRLAMDPEVLLFDEPTSALDPELVGEVLRVIRDLAEEGRTMLLVTHEMKFARDVSSHVIYLHKGLIEEEGPPKQVFGSPKSDRCRQFVSTVH